MANFLTYYRAHNPTIYSVIVSILLIVWYNGLVGVLNFLFPDRGILIALMFMIIPLVSFYTDGQNLDELYSRSSTAYEMGSANNVMRKAYRRNTSIRGARK